MEATYRRVGVWAVQPDAGGNQTSGEDETVRILRDFQRHELSDERWPHIVEHPEMAGMGAALEETVCSPELVICRVRAPRTDPGTALHYRYYLHTFVGGKWLCVVVKFGVVEPFVLTVRFRLPLRQSNPFQSAQKQLQKVLLSFSDKASGCLS